MSLIERINDIVEYMESFGDCSMSNNETTVNFSGLLPTLLFITFLVLKLTNVITWSWWWVTAPIWIPFGLSVLTFIAILVFGSRLINKFNVK